MKSIVFWRGLALCLLLFPHWIQCQSKDIRSQAEYWPATGTLREKHEFYHDFWSERDVMHGRHSKWTKRDRLVLEDWYSEGLRDSVMRRWFRNGSMREQSFWQDGVRNGNTKCFDRKGRLCFETGYQNGVRHGMEYRYHRNGELKALYRYEKGCRHGHGSVYDKRGEVKRQFHYEYGYLRHAPKPTKVESIGKVIPEQEDAIQHQKSEGKSRKESPGKVQRKGEKEMHMGLPDKREQSPSPEKGKNKERPGKEPIPPTK